MTTSVWTAAVFSIKDHQRETVRYAATPRIARIAEHLDVRKGVTVLEVAQVPCYTQWMDSADISVPRDYPTLRYLMKRNKVHFRERMSDDKVRGKQYRRYELRREALQELITGLDDHVHMNVRDDYHVEQSTYGS